MAISDIGAALVNRAKKAAASEDSASFARYVNEIEPARHHELICKICDSVLDDLVLRRKARRVMILAPPGSAKSTYVTHNFAAFAMGKIPSGYNIGVGTHTDEFSKDWSKKVRDTVVSERFKEVFPDVEINPGDRAAQKWSTLDNRRFFGVGVGGTITGKRVDLLILDDLIRGIEDADSKAARRKIISWYKSDAYTRLKPGGSIIIINTRWHEEDLPGYLMEQMEEGTGEEWEIIKLQAICEEPEEDPMHRKYGEALWPQWQDETELTRIRDKVADERMWSCLYQQNASPKGGLVVLEDWFGRYSRVDLEIASKKTSLYKIWISIDTAETTSQKNDPTVALAFLETLNGELYLLREYRQRREHVKLSKEIREFVTNVHQLFGKITGVLIENKGGGRPLGSEIKTHTRYSVILTEPKELGDKSFRFDEATPFIEAGKLHLPEGESKWVKDYMTELTTFPASRHDDRVDATSQIINYLSKKQKRKRRRGRKTQS